MSAPRSATPLEMQVDAAIATLGAWCYPSDHDIRGAAVKACQLVGVDYIPSIAMVMEGTGADAHTARRKVAAGFLANVGALAEKGAEPRQGVLGGGGRIIDLDADTEEV